MVVIEGVDVFDEVGYFELLGCRKIWGFGMV